MIASGCRESNLGCGVDGVWKDVLVGECGKNLAGLGCEANDAGGEPGLRGDGNLGATGLDGVVDDIGGVVDVGGEPGGLRREFKPALFFGLLAGEVCVFFATRAHQTRADSGHANTFAAQLGVQTLGEAGESELGGDVGQEVWNWDLASDRGDVDDAAIGLVWRVE